MIRTSSLPRSRAHTQSPAPAGFGVRLLLFPVLAVLSLFVRDGEPHPHYSGHVTSDGTLSEWNSLTTAERDGIEPFG